MEIHRFNLGDEIKKLILYYFFFKDSDSNFANFT